MTDFNTADAPLSDPPDPEVPAPEPGPLNKLKALSRRAKALAGRVWTAVRPGPRAWKGAAVGVLFATLVVFAALVIGTVAPTSPILGVTALVLVLLLASALFGGLGSLAAVLLSRLPRAFRWVSLGSLPMLALVGGAGGGGVGAVSVILATLGIASLLGAGIGAARGWKSGEVVRLHQGIAISGFAVGSLALVAGLIWLAIGGSAAEPIRNAADETGILVPALDLPDPSGAGSFRVLSLTYGSGMDRHRPEFGSEVGLTTGPVDGTPFVDGWEGYVGWFRDRYWGFSVDSLPLNGRVWYPDGPGPFPLMLVVHGNHLAEDFSDPGYEYLGELLASRGLIVVSVDENFLNSTLTDVFSGLETENDARGWLLLEHLSVWRAWNDSPGNPFHGKVDLGNIGLVGHSRGGEAVSEAASFNRLSHYPDDATVPFDYGFDLRAVIAIAPVDAQYNPTDRPTPIQDVNYLVLHGSMDGDVSSFVGQGTYERVEFTDGADWFKAAFYIHGANHGQFNTSWGRSDMGSPIDWFYNLDQIMPPEDQEKAAKVVISAFVEASLKGMDGYRTLFREPRTASHWLPETVYLSRFETAQDLTIASFEEDMDVATATLPGAQMEAAHLTVWREERVKGKWEQSFSTNAAFLGWDTIDAGDTASYAITLTPSMVETGPETVLVFGLADANEDPNPGKEEEEEEEDGDDGGGDEKANEEGDPEEPGGAEGAEGEGEEAEVDEDEEEDKPREPIDFTIQVWDATGQVAGLPLSSVSLLQPQIEVGLRKANFMDDGPKGEIVLESFEFPLVFFREANPSFDPNTLTGFRFVFDLTEAGVIVLDGVAFREREIADGG